MSVKNPSVPLNRASVLTDTQSIDYRNIISQDAERNRTGTCCASSPRCDRHSVRFGCVDDVESSMLARCDSCKWGNSGVPQKKQRAQGLMWGGSEWGNGLQRGSVCASQTIRSHRGYACVSPSKTTPSISAQLPPDIGDPWKRASRIAHRAKGKEGE